MKVQGISYLGYTAAREEEQSEEAQCQILISYISQKPPLLSNVSCTNILPSLVINNKLLLYPIASEALHL